jgi:hypothetical protein
MDEGAIVNTLKNPDEALKQVQTERAKANEAAKGKKMRYVGMGLAGIAGGALIGVTGGLAAPLVGGAVSTVLGFFGVGGTVAGLLASGLAGSSVVCSTLFGVYGARTSATIVQNHMREIRDLELVPVRPPRETLAVRLCISGWLNDEVDVVEPWKIFGTNCDTYALRWVSVPDMGVKTELTSVLGSGRSQGPCGCAQVCYEIHNSWIPPIRNFKTHCTGCVDVSAVAFTLA